MPFEINRITLYTKFHIIEFNVLPRRVVLSPYDNLLNFVNGIFIRFLKVLE